MYPEDRLATRVHFALFGGAGSREAQIGALHDAFQYIGLKVTPLPEYRSPFFTGEDFAVADALVRDVRKEAGLIGTIEKEEEIIRGILERYRRQHCQDTPSRSFWGRFLPALQRA